MSRVKYIDNSAQHHKQSHMSSQCSSYWRRPSSAGALSTPTLPRIMSVTMLTAKFTEYAAPAHITGSRGVLAEHDKASWRWQGGRLPPATRLCISTASPISALAMHSATHLRWTPAWGLHSGLFGSWHPCTSAAPLLSLHSCLCVYAHGPGVVAYGCRASGQGRLAPPVVTALGPLACQAICLSFRSPMTRPTMLLGHSMIEFWERILLLSVSGRAATTMLSNCLK